MVSSAMCKAQCTILDAMEEAVMSCSVTILIIDVFLTAVSEISAFGIRVL